jgi:hypothetical protein
MKAPSDHDRSIPTLVLKNKSQQLPLKGGYSYGQYQCRAIAQIYYRVYSPLVVPVQSYHKELQQKTFSLCSTNAELSHRATPDKEKSDTSELVTTWEDSNS